MAGKSAPKNETPADRFIRLANSRAGNAAKSIDSLGKLVGAAYQSTPEQHKKLFDFLRGRIAAAESVLAANKASARGTTIII